MSKNKLKVSVIIPVYNAEKYISECINSLINQTLKECEFIFINDGSTDNSAEIIKKYQLLDNRIKLFSQKNKGISGARNTGIHLAKGEYIGFVDNDDFVEKDMFETLYKKAIERTNIDIVISKTILGRDNKYVIRNSIFPPEIEYNKNYIEKNIIPNLLLKEDLFAVWNKIYNKKFIDENNILFPENRNIEEDNMFNLSAFSKAKRVYFIEYAGYYYRDVNSSESRKILEADLFPKAIKKYQFNYKEYFKLNMDSTYIEHLKLSRLFNRSCYLIFILSINTQYSFNDIYTYCRGIISNEILLNIKNNKIINENGYFGKVIQKIIQKQSTLSLFITIKLLRLFYSPKISEFLRKINKKN